MKSMQWPSDSRLRQINWALLLVIILCGLYLIVTPFVPQITFKVKNHLNPPKKMLYEQPSTLTGIDRSYDQLIMPTINLDKPIHEGTNPNTVNLGIWRRPLSSTPDKGSNTVFVGHRFTYTGSGILYFLNDIKMNDEIFVVWQGKIYAYKVDNIQTVLPTDYQVEQPSKQSEITIYSCTPLWSTSHRLVINANLEKVL